MENEVEIHKVSTSIAQYVQWLADQWRNWGVLAYLYDSSLCCNTRLRERQRAAIEGKEPAITRSDAFE